MEALSLLPGGTHAHRIRTGWGRRISNNMPLSRNRKLTRNEQRKRKAGRLYRQVLHRGYLAMLNGAMNREQYNVFKYFAKRRLLLGDKAAHAFGTQ